MGDLFGIVETKTGHITVGDFKRVPVIYYTTEHNLLRCKVIDSKSDLPKDLILTTHPFCLVD